MRFYFKVKQKNHLKISDPVTSNTNWQTQKDAIADQLKDISICKVIYSCLWSSEYTNNL